MSLELHRQCVFPALAVVGGVDGVNVPPPARKLGGVIPADTVELHGMDAAQRTDKPLLAVLPMIQLHKVHHAPQDSRPEGIRFALPRFHDVPQSFAVDLFAQLVVQLQRRAHAADAVVAQLHTVVVEGKPRPVSGCDKRLGRRIAAHHLGAQLDARRQGCGVTVLLRKEQGFLLLRQTCVDFAEDRAVRAAVEEDAALDGVLSVHHIVPAVAEADLRLVNDVLVEVPGDQLHPLALHAPLVEFAGIDQLAAVDECDTIFVGFPIWWYVAPTIINTFLESYDLKNKTIIPFATSGSSDMGKTNEKLAPSCPGSKLLHGKVFNASSTKADLSAWVDSLNFSRGNTMNIFEEKTDSELLSYFSDYQKLCSLDKYTGFQNPDFTAILKSYREKFGPIGEGVLGHDFFEAVFHRWEKTVHND